MSQLLGRSVVAHALVDTVSAVEDEVEADSATAATATATATATGVWAISSSDHSL